MHTNPFNVYSISVSSALKVYTIMCYINPHFTYLLASSTKLENPHSTAQLSF